VIPLQLAEVGISSPAKMNEGLGENFGYMMVKMHKRQLGFARGSLKKS